MRFRLLEALQTVLEPMQFDGYDHDRRHVSRQSAHLATSGQMRSSAAQAPTTPKTIPEAASSSTSRWRTSTLML